MSVLSSWILGILGTVTAALIILAIKGYLWMRQSVIDQKADHNLMAQRMSYNESMLSKIEETHNTQYKELSDKHDKQHNDLLTRMDQTLAVLTDIKLAFSEVRMKNEENERRIERMEKQAS